jgi:hypothetical protein
VPPFSAPPTEGRATRLWVGLGVAGLAVLLVCGGGTAAVVGLGVTGTRALNEQGRAVVREYLDAVVRHEYAAAYGLLCDRLKRAESQRQFASRISAEPQIVTYRLHDLQMTPEMAVPADVRFATGRETTRRYVLTQDGSTGTLRVCGVRE